MKFIRFWPDSNMRFVGTDNRQSIPTMIFIQFSALYERREFEFSCHNRPASRATSESYQLWQSLPNTTR